jgi:acyl carrier protein
MNDQIRTILKENAHLPVSIDTLSDEQNLYDAGMSSHSTVNVMLALEDEFDVEFPARLLRRSVFSSVASIHNAIRELCTNTELAH